MRSFPAGRPSTQTVSPIPNPIATPAHSSANSTVWWWKNPLNPPPSQSQRRDAPARGSFYQTRRGRAAGEVKASAFPRLPAGAELRTVLAELLRDGPRHVNRVVAVAERHPHGAASFADGEVDRRSVRELPAGRRA